MSMAWTRGRAWSLGLLVLASLVSAGQAHARQSGPDAVYERYEATIERQIAAAETRIERQADTAETSIDRLIEREASESAILRAINSALRGFESTIRSVSTGLLRSANSSKRSLERLEAAAERRDDTDTAEEAAAYIEEIDDDIANITEERDEVLSFLAQFRAAIGGSDDPGEAFEVESDELVADLEDFTNSLNDDDMDDDEDEEDDAE